MLKIGDNPLSLIVDCMLVFCLAGKHHVTSAELPGFCWVTLGVALDSSKLELLRKRQHLSFQDLNLVALVAGVMMAFAFQLLVTFSIL